MKSRFSIATLVTALVLAAASASHGVDVTGDQSGTWTSAKSPYVVTGWVNVPGGQSLTIEAGVVVKFAGAQGLEVRGSLTAQGTAASPIVFTTIVDDSGGDTNGDGTASTPVPDSWYSIRVYDGSTVLLDNCQIRYAGYSDDAAVVVRGAATPTISNCLISDTHGDGIRVYDTAKPILSDNTISGAWWPVHLLNRGALPVFRNNTFRKVTNYGVRYEEATVAAGEQVTWPDAGVPYSVDWISVEATGSLTLPPGLVVKFRGAQGLEVRGAFTAQGTTSRPVVFTAGSDDTGGDTNGDTTASAPVADSWYSIRVYDGSTVLLDNCQIRYAGYSDDAAVVVKGAATPTLSNCLITDTHGDGIRVYDTAKPVLNSNTISGAWWPVHLLNRGAQPVYSNNTFRRVTNYGVRYEDAVVTAGEQVTWPDAGVPYSVDWVTVEATGSLTLPPGLVVKFRGAHGIEVYGALTAQGTADRPIVFTAGADDLAGDTNGDTTDTAPVPDSWYSIRAYGGSNVLLDNCQIRYAGYSDDAAVAVRGAATPTISNCLIADTDGDGVRVYDTAKPILSSNTISGAWWPVHLFNRGALPVFKNNTFRKVTNYGIRYEDAVVEKGQQVTWPDAGVPYSVDWVTVEATGSLTLPPGLVVKFRGAHGIEASGALTAQGTADRPIVFTAGTDDLGGDTNGDTTATAPVPDSWYSIRVHDGSTVLLDNCQIRYAGYSDDAAVVVEGAAVPTIANCLLADTHGDGIRVYGSAKPILSNNTISGAWWPVHLFNRGALPVFTNNTFRKVTNYGVRYEDAVVEKGQQVTWPDAGVPYSVDWVTVEATGSLTLPPGLVVKFRGVHGIEANGALTAQGTADRPIVFTAGTDDLGGDTNGDSTATAPVPDSWYSIRVHDGSTVLLDNCQIRYAGYSDDAAVVVRGSATPTLANTAITDAHGDGVRVYDAARPVLTPNNEFDRNTGYAVNNVGTGTADARSNWWGDATGPQHPTLNPAGKGQPVTDRVDFQPFLTAKPVVVVPLPVVDLKVTQLTMDDTQVGSMTQKTLVVGNTGDATLGVDSAAVQGTDAAQFRVAPTRFAVEPGKSQTVTVTFAPTSAGGKGAALVLGHNAVGSPSTVALQGRAVEAPALAVSPAQLAFADTRVGGTSQKTFTVTNAGAAAVTIARIAVQGPDAAQFKVTPSNLTLGAKTSRTVTVTFTPTSTGAKSATVALGTGTAGPVTVALQGTATEAQAALRLSVTQLSFTDTKVGGSSRATFTVTNSGTSPVSVAKVAVQGPDAAQFKVAPSNLTLGAKASRTVTVTFTPTSAGAKSATVALAVGAAAPITVALQGTGIEAPALQLSVTQLSFTDTKVGGSSRATFTVTNAGTSPVSVARIAVQGPDAAQFKVAPSNLTLGAKAGRTVTVTFTPTSAGAKSATVALAVGAAAPVTVALQGTAVEVAVPPTVSPSQLAFGEVMVGGSAQRTVTVTNPGSAPVALSAIAVQGADAAQFRVDPAALNLPARGKATVTVVFAPNGPGDKTATLSLGTGTGTPLAVGLRGRGVAAGLAFTPPHLVFEDVAVGTTAQLTSTVTNGSGAALQVSSLTVRDDDQGAFRVSPTSLSLAAGAKGTITVSFAPKTAGPSSAQIVLDLGAGLADTLEVQGMAHEAEAGPPSAGGAEDAWGMTVGTVMQVLGSAPTGGTVPGAKSGQATVKLSVGLSGPSYTIVFDRYSDDGLTFVTGSVNVRPVAAQPGAAAWSGKVELTGLYAFTLEFEVRFAGDKLTGTIKVNGEEVALAKPVAAAAEVRPSTTTLAPNYPNPFNGGTAIPYYLSGAAETRITVYNLLGQQVRLLVDQALGPGWHQASWDGLDDQGQPATSGVYVYELRTGASAQQRTLTLLR